MWNCWQKAVHTLSIFFKIWVNLHFDERNLITWHFQKENKKDQFLHIHQNWVSLYRLFLRGSKWVLSLMLNRNCFQASLGHTDSLEQADGSLTYLYEQDGEDAHFISQLPFCPVLIHSADHCDDVILKEKASCQLCPPLSGDGLFLWRPVCTGEQRVELLSRLCGKYFCHLKR